MNTEIIKNCSCENCSCESKSILPENIIQFIEKCLKEERPESQLIAVLHKVQGHFGYLAPQTMDAVAYLMQIPAAKVSGVASFYHYFRLKPCGKFIIKVCLGTACYVKGAQAVFDKFSEELGIKEGETTKDCVFTLEVARCLGTCALAPVVQIGDDIHSQITSDQVPGIIEHYINKK